MVKLVAIDEAGRGPVIGPMVLCGVMVDDKEQFKLKLLGARDSKLLSVAKRKEVFELLKKEIEYKVIIVPPKEIDNTLFSENTNLNWLEADKSIEIINHFKPDRIILDCPSNNREAYAGYIKERLVKKDAEIKAEFKADSKYFVVGAASIIAKVIRDEEIDKLKKKYNVEFGSGYPSDERTRDFLKKNYDKYDFFRKSWASYKNVAVKSSQKGLGEF
ncbi:ribonuclease HII [Candidatus Woesearchaeota archaeon]|nr:ribonuclease HII [Candidatus Woesearchaeota archaeon]MBL7050877.1 ribonuclease HII [Candidatus Woesearchaeota archaeon]